MHNKTEEFFNFSYPPINILELLMKCSCLYFSLTENYVKIGKNESW